MIYIIFMHTYTPTRIYIYIYIYIYMYIIHDKIRYMCATFFVLCIAFYWIVFPRYLVTFYVRSTKFKLV